jgi:hypothetical protein
MNHHDFLEADKSKDSDMKGMPLDRFSLGRLAANNQYDSSFFSEKAPIAGGFSTSFAMGGPADTFFGGPNERL